MSDPKPRSVRTWANTCLPERQANLDMALASAGLSQFVLKDTIIAYFEADTTTDPEKRLAVWVQVWQVLEDTVVIGETEFEVYVANQQWMLDLYAAWLAEEISLEDDFGSLLNFYPDPVTRTP